jgi:16S rRNA processing protein RimM
MRLGTVRLGDDGEPRPDGAQQVEWARVAQRSIVLKLAAANDREAAERLRGADLLVPGDEVWPLPEGSYYHFDLVGLTVIDPSGRRRGRLARVYAGPANDFYAVVRDQEPGDPAVAPAGTRRRGTRRPAREILVPAVRHVVLDVNLEAGTITMDWAELVGEEPTDAH